MTTTRSGTPTRPDDPSPRTDEPGARRLRHIPALDGIRGLGLILVVATHALLGFGGVYRDWLPGGFVGLDAFFVLSGFLITSLLLGEQHRNGRVSLRGFYRRRALRLLPALFFLLFVHAAYSFVTDLSMTRELTSTIVILGYATNWYRAAGHGMAMGMGHLWSLSVEEQFYFIWPIILVGALGIRRSSRVVYVTLACSILAVSLWRYLLWRHGTPLIALQERFDCRADSLIVGALAGHIYVRRGLPRVRFSMLAWPALAFLTYIVAFLPASRAFFYQGGYTLVAIATGLMILAIAEGGWAGSALFNFTLFRKLGIVSYGVYLWHLPIFLAVLRAMPDTANWIRLTVALSLTAIATAVSWFGIERPCQRMKGGTRRNPVTPVAVPAAT